MFSTPTEETKGHILPRLRGRPRRSAPVLAALYTDLQSQRDYVLQPRVARDELPWVTVPSIANPERFAALSRCLLRRKAGTTLSGLESPRHRRPRVARPSQPWALLRNPFGIHPPPPVLKIRIRCSVPGHSKPRSSWRARILQGLAVFPRFCARGRAHSAPIAYFADYSAGHQTAIRRAADQSAEDSPAALPLLLWRRGTGRGGRNRSGPPRQFQGRCAALRRWIHRCELSSGLLSPT